jgi:hypothetical protein
MPIHCWWEYKLVQLLWKTIWRLLTKLNIDLPYDPAIPLLGIKPKGMQLRLLQRHWHTQFITALFTIVKLWKQSRCPTTGK